MLDNKSFLVVFLQLVQTLLVASTAIFTTYLLGVEDYGRFVYLITAASILPLFAGLGSEHVFIMKASRCPKLIPVLFGNALFIRVVITIVSILFIAILLAVFSLEDFRTSILIATGSLLAVFANPLFLSFYRVKGLHLRPWLINFISPIIFLVYLLLISDNNSKLLWVSLGFCFSHTIAFIVFLVDIRKIIKPIISFRYIRKHFKLGFVFSVSQGFDFAFSRVDIFLLQFISGPSAVGIYAAGQKIITLLQVIPSSFHIVELPEFHRISSNASLLKAKFRSLRKLLLEFGIIFFGVFILNANFIIELLYSKEFYDAAAILKLLSISGLLLFVNYPYYMLAEAINKIKQRMYMRIITFVITVALVYVFIILFGSPGAAVGLIIGQVIFMLLLHLITQPLNGGVSALIRDFAMLLMAAPVFALGLCVQSLFENEIVILISGSGIFLLIFLLVGSYSGMLEFPKMAKRRLRRYLAAFKTESDSND